MLAIIIAAGCAFVVTVLLLVGVIWAGLYFLARAAFGRADTW